MVMAKAFAQMWGQGLTLITGPRIAALLLKECAEELGRWDDQPLKDGGVKYGVQSGLMPEIRRLSNVLMHGPNGWQMVPWQSVVDQKLLDEDEISEVEGVVCFFICASAIHRKAEIPALLKATDHWGTTGSSSTCTELLTSLQTSSAPATTWDSLATGTLAESPSGEKKRSSIPT